MSQEKTEDKTGTKQALSWKCLCDQCENRDKCFELLKKSGVLRKLGITSPDELHEKLAIALVSFLGGIAIDEIIHAALGRRHRKRLF